MKKTILWLIIIISTLSLTLIGVGCKEEAAPAEEVTEKVTEEVTEEEAAPVEEEAKDKYNIGVSWQGVTNDWASSELYHLKYGFEVKYADKLKNVYMFGCDMDDKKQIADIEDLISKDIDLLLIDPVSETSLATVIEKAKDSGIPVVIFGASAGTNKYDSYINRDNVKSGYQYADWMGKRLNGKGNVIVIMGFPGSGYSNDVLKGVDDGLKNYPDIKVLGTEYAMYTPATSKQIVESYLTKGDKIDGVIVDGGLMDFGVLEAFSDAKLPLPPTTGDDYTGFLRKVKELNYTDFVSISGGSELALDAVDIAFKLLAGEQVTRDNLIAPKYYEGKDIIGMINEDMPDSFWLECKIPKEDLSKYYTK